MTVHRTLEIYARDPDLVVRAPLPWTTAELTLNHLGVGTWTVTMPATARAREHTNPGWGIVAVLDGTVVLSGTGEEREWVRTGRDDGVLEVAGADDMAVVAGALAWPTPSAAIEAQGGWDARSGPAETVIKAYIAANIGLGRAATRRDAAAPDVREVVVAPDLQRGPAVDYRARYEPLMDLIRNIALPAGLGATVTQNGDQLLFDVFAPQTQPAAVFSFELGNLRRCRWVEAAPESTHVIVGGDGEDSARLVRRRANSAAAQTWRVTTEKWVDARSETTVSGVERAGDAALADAERSGIVEAELVDTPRLRYGDGYALGDRVTIIPAPGVAFTDVVTAVAISADRERGTVTVTPSVGWRDGPLTRQDRELAQLRRAVSALERST